MTQLYYANDFLFLEQCSRQGLMGALVRHLETLGRVLGIFLGALTVAWEAFSGVLGDS